MTEKNGQMRSVDIAWKHGQLYKKASGTPINPCVTKEDLANFSSFSLTEWVPSSVISSLKMKLESVRTKIDEELSHVPRYDWEIQREQAFKEIQTILEEGEEEK